MFKIRNGNATDFEASFNGKLYKFPAGKTVACEDDAAKHIFGIGEQNKTPVLARHGWVKVMGSTEEGLAILKNFKFESVEPDLGVPFADNDLGPAPGIQEAGEAESGADDSGANSPAHRGPGRPRREASAVI